MDDENDPQDPAPELPSNNAFKLDEGVGVDLSNCIIHNGDDVTITYYDEVWTSTPTWKHTHIEWDGNNSLINVDANFTDPDGSDGDCGLHGGPLGDENGKPQAETRWRRGRLDWWDTDRSPYFIVLNPDGAMPATGTLPRARYRYFDDYDIEENSSFTITAGSDIAAMEDYIYFKVHGEILSLGTANLKVKFHSELEFWENSPSTVYDWRGIRLYSTASLESKFENTEIYDTYSTYAGVYVDRADEDPTSDRVLLDYCYIYNCGVGVKTYAADVRLLNTLIFNNEYYGVYSRSGTGGEVLIDEGTYIFGNGDSGTYSAGVRLSNANVWMTDCRVDYNEKYGLNCFSSNPLMTPIYGGVSFAYNENSNIYLRGNSYPVTDDGHNDFIPSEGEWDVEFDDDTQDYVWDATGNWWGTDTPDEDEDELFSHPELIDYSDWDDNPNINNAEDYTIGLSLMIRGRFDEAIPYFMRFLTGRIINYANAFRAINHLRTCFVESGNDLRELQEFYSSLEDHLDVGRNTETLLIKAANESIWCLFDMDMFEEAYGAFVDRRNELDNDRDSLRNEINILLAGLALNENEGEEIDSDLNAELEFDLEFERLLKMIDSLSSDPDKAAGELLPDKSVLESAYPNPFNSTTRISFVLPENDFVKLTIIDTNGRVVRILYEGEVSSGRSELTFAANSLAGGLYFSVLKTSESTLRQKLIFLK